MTHRIGFALLVGCVAACTGKVGGGPDDDTPDNGITNTAPTLQLSSPSLQTSEDQSGNITGSSNDAEGDAVTLTVVAQAEHGEIAATIEGGSVTVTYTPAPNYNGSDAVTLLATDARGASSTPIVVPITVIAVDDPLLAVDDDVTADEDDPATFTTLLANDSDADQTAPLTITAVDALSAEGASLVLGSDGTITYTPAAQFNALAPGATRDDTFQYTVGNATGASAIATVRVQVAGRNDAPTITPPAQSTITCQPHLSLPTLQLDGGDADAGQTLVYTRAGGSCPATLGTTSQGSIAGECPAVGADCLATFSVSDGIASATVDLMLTANTIFVAPGGTGDGGNWVEALGDLQAAFDAARPAGKAVWVKRGVFAPAAELTLVQPAPPPVSPPAFHVVGSFAGTESVLSERGAPTQWTRLNGSNAHRVLRTRFAIADINGFLIENAEATEPGGGIYAFGSELTLTDVGFLVNSTRALGAAAGYGGGLAVEGGLATIDHCDFAFNFVTVSSLGDTANGGALAMLDFASVTIARSVFVSNSVEGRTGLDGDPGEAGGDGGTARGAAIYNQNGSLFIDTTTFLFNEAYGGTGGAGGFSLTGPGGDGGRGGDAWGGAVFTGVEQLVITNTRFIENVAWIGAGGAGGVGLALPAGGGVAPRGGHGGDSGSAFGGALAIEGLVAQGVISDSVFRGNIAGFMVGADENFRAGAGGTGGDGEDGGGAGGNGGHGGTVAGGALHVSAAGPLRIVNVQFAQNTARAPLGGIGGNGGPSSALGGDAGAGGDAGLARGGAADLATLTNAGNIAALHVSLLGNSARTGVAAASAGSPGVGSPNGGSAPNGAIPTAAGGGLNGTAGPGLASFGNSALFGNVVHDGTDTTSDVAGAVAIASSCMAQVFAGATLLGSSPFEAPLIASSDLFLVASPPSPCVDVGSADLDNAASVIWTDKTTRSDGVLDTGLPDAGTHYGPSTAFILSASQTSGQPVQYAATNVTSCEGREFSTDTINRIPGPAAGTMIPTQIGWAMLLVCGTSSTHVQVVP